MKFHKYHALGNDYIVIDPRETKIKLTIERIKHICHRNFGIGSDGILFGSTLLDKSFELQIFNPDGSEAEKSGNGLRIFTRYLWDIGLIHDEEIKISTKGGNVKAIVFEGGKKIKIEMGQLSFNTDIIPVKGETGEVLGKTLNAGGKIFKYNAATIGNPHCVIALDNISPELAKEFGPIIERNPIFPNRTNVQFMKILDRSHIQIEIWERGAGYTLASGSSSVAAAGVAFKTGLCDRQITVKMQGGEIDIELDDGFNATMTGPVSPVFDGEMKDEYITEI